MDKILFALLALCAIIMVFATAVTLVQALYFKLIQTRRDGMMTLLRSIYRDAVEPRLKQAGVHDPKTFDARHKDRFALDMTVNRAFPEKGWRKFLSDRPILRRYWGARVESMSTRQFAEHLAGTDVGEKIAVLPPEKLKMMLRELAYEFERMGELQIRTFKTKVGVQTVIIGVLLAFLFNVDLLRTFKALSADTDLAQKVTLAMMENAQRLTVATADAQPAVQAAEATPGEPAPDNPGAQPVVEKQALEQAVLINQASADAVAQILTQVNSDSAMFGLPIGFAGYPFCQAAVTGTPVAGAATRPSDERCNRQVEVDPIGAFGGMIQPLFGPNKDAKPTELAGRQANAAHLTNLKARLFDKTGGGVVWFFSVFFAGACFGLGAPFWFDIFNRLSSLAASRGVAQLTPPRKTGDGTESAAISGPPPTAVRAKTCVTPEELFDAFVISARSNGVAGAWDQPVTPA